MFLQNCRACSSSMVVQELLSRRRMASASSSAAAVSKPDSTVKSNETPYSAVALNYYHQNSAVKTLSSASADPNLQSLVHLTNQQLAFLPVPISNRVINSRINAGDLYMRTVWRRLYLSHKRRQRLGGKLTINHLHQRSDRLSAAVLRQSLLGAARTGSSDKGAQPQPRQPLHSDKDRDNEQQKGANMMRCSSVPGAPSDPDRPNWQHLQHVVLRLDAAVPVFFNVQHDYTFYREDIFFDNRITRYRTFGLRPYMAHMAVLSVLGRLPCAHVHMETVSVFPSVEDGTVRLRWRVVYIPLYKIHKMFGLPQDKHKRMEAINKLSSWYDGYSVFHLDGQGRVYKHVVDRVMSDGSRLSDETILERLSKRLLGAPAQAKL